MAQGESGQRPFVIPALQLVAAIASGNYGQETREYRRHAFCGR
jgi:hypothetical protein